MRQTASAVCLALVVLAALHTASAAAVIVHAFEQCGGVLDCPQELKCRDAPWRKHQCSQGFACVRQDGFFWQCIPAELQRRLAVGIGLSTVANQNTSPDIYGVMSRKRSAQDTTQPILRNDPGASSQASIDDVLTALPVPADSPSGERPSGAAEELELDIAMQQSSDYESLQQLAITEVAGAWKQCGGINGCTLGPMQCGDRQWAACPRNFLCYRQDKYYHQCREDRTLPLELRAYLQKRQQADASGIVRPIRQTPVIPVIRPKPAAAKVDTLEPSDPLDYQLSEAEALYVTDDPLPSRDAAHTTPPTLTMTLEYTGDDAWMLEMPVRYILQVSALCRVCWQWQWQWASCFCHLLEMLSGGGSTVGVMAM